MEKDFIMSEYLEFQRYGRNKSTLVNIYLVGNIVRNLIRLRIMQDLSRLLYSKAKIMYDLYFADSYKKLHDEYLAQYEVLKNCQKLMIFMISNFER